MSSITWCKASCKSVSLALCSPSWSNMSGIKDLVSLYFCSQLSAFLNTKRRWKWLLCLNSFFLSLCNTFYKYTLACYELVHFYIINLQSSDSNSAFKLLHDYPYCCWPQHTIEQYSQLFNIWFSTKVLCCLKEDLYIPAINIFYFAYWSISRYSEAEILT